MIMIKDGALLVANTPYKIAIILYSDRCSLFPVKSSLIRYSVYASEFT